MNILLSEYLPPSEAKIDIFFTVLYEMNDPFLLVTILHMFEELVPNLHTREKSHQFFRCDKYLPILHTSEIINMRNLSTNLQGVKKVRRHYTISYNVGSNDHSILKLHRFQELFYIKVSTMLHFYNHTLL